MVRQGTDAGSGRGELIRVARGASPDDVRRLTVRIEPRDGLRDHSGQAAALLAGILHADAEHRHRSYRARGSPDETLFFNTETRCESGGRAVGPGRPRRFARGRAHESNETRGSTTASGDRASSSGRGVV